MSNNSFYVFENNVILHQKTAYKRNWYLKEFHLKQLNAYKYFEVIY